jgi:hypothetical protein
MSKLNFESIADVTEINFYTRMLHLSQLYTTINETQSYQKNITVLAQSLQDKQFSIKDLYIDSKTSTVYITN